ncbi:MAG TPA: hypothetical protein VGF28_15590 [Thermoanaerobaculia bacterium]
MSMIPAVRAVLAERYILNFRMRPDAMRRFLPVPWLEPAEVGGYAVASFCMLDLRNITVAPLPALAGLSSLSCAPRYAVTDTSSGAAKPAVFVTERYTNSSLGSWFTSLGFSAPHPHVDAAIVREGDAVRLSVADRDRQLFSARVTAGETRDSIFTAKSFADFIAQGVSSYGLSIHGNRLTRVDLHKNDGTYEPLEALHFSGPVVEEWVNAGAVLDSAFRTSDGQYEWTYLGLTE